MIMIPMAVIMEAVMMAIKAISTPWPQQIRVREEDADRNANETQEVVRGENRCYSLCQSVNTFGNQLVETQLGH